ncbi:MAG: UDP-glucose/GDP-mannose dehydrogenase family protein [Candidatus Altiarchaeota archaeon]|nr:UDP-glucose/GDP-mannose dehydrogenase family protein [Candidatus Altiarchaeota archaeon]
MKVSIIGVGYVGLITGSCFAELKNDVTCVDVIKEKVQKINGGETPIYEEGLEDLLKKHVGKSLRATTDTESAVLNSEVTFIAVGTPDAPEGGIDLKYIESAAEDIGKALAKKKGYHVVVVKSTVIPGTTDSVVLPILEKNSGKKAGKDFGVAMNPEFLREGKAIDDFMKPDRIVIGAQDEKAASVLEKLYEEFGCPKLKTDLRTAEMIKYASNAFLATKISYINEMANICEKVGTDVVDVARGIGLDHRISPYFLQAGAGWGGSCFPKDVKALVELAKREGYETKMLNSALEVNKRQAEHMVEALEGKIGDVKGKKIAVLGLAFKPGTDDVREAPSLKIVKRLVEKKAGVFAYDSVAKENFERVVGCNIAYARSMEECIKDADACLIVTDWKEFKVDPSVFVKNMKKPVVIDGRRIMDPEKAKEAGIDYFGIGFGRF